MGDKCLYIRRNMQNKFHFCIHWYAFDCNVLLLLMLMLTFIGGDVFASALVTVGMQHWWSSLWPQGECLGSYIPDILNTCHVSGFRVDWPAVRRIPVIYEEKLNIASWCTVWSFSARIQQQSLLTTFSLIQRHNNVKLISSMKQNLQSAHSAVHW